MNIGGPGNSILKREEGQAYLRLGPERMQSAGNFRVDAEDRKWGDGFSLNAPPEESNLERLGIDQIEALLGLMVSDEGQLSLDFEDEVIAGACITREREIVHEGAKAAASAAA